MRTKKSFGQHLLTDKAYLDKILESIELNPNDVVLEIGAGSGILTSQLAKVVKKVYAVEPERAILNKLKNNISSNEIKNVEIIEASFLKLDLNKIFKQPVKIFGNIPYNITSGILLKLFGEIDKPASHLQLLKKIYLMVQYEVAERIVAKVDSKAYSPLSLLIQYFSEPNILFSVPRSAFSPSPRVDSAFVSFDIKKSLLPIKDPKFLKDIIRVSFQQRRKKITNSLNKLIDDKDRTIKVFDKLGLDHNLRAENLDFKTFVKIAENI